MEEALEYLLKKYGFRMKRRVKRLVKRGVCTLSDDELRRLLRDIWELRKGFYGIILYYRNDPMAPSFLGYLDDYIDGSPAEFARNFSLNKAIEIKEFLDKLEEYVTKFLTSYQFENP